MACKGQSRGFMGQTIEWIADWISGENGEADRINMSGSTILTHSVEGEIVGIVCIGIYGHESEKGAVLWVGDLAVHPDFQRRGIAAKLMKQGLCYGKENGAKRAFLMADDTNAGAIHLYEKMGFVGNENEYEINMVKMADMKEA
ncbi:MAG: GNAT family N-acetyltransferase [Clostridiales bacterium]|nr:GNAT family N-acetyltransferase [Clostridiales bacterium]